MSSTQYVIFLLDNEEYGIDISFTQEIIRIPKQIAKIPNSPAYLEGLSILRGNVIPIIDLKERFGIEQVEKNNNSRLLIINFDNKLIGIIVDDVSEVLTLDEELVESISSEISKIGDNSLKGIGKIEGRLILLIDEIKLKEELLQNG